MADFDPATAYNSAFGDATAFNARVRLLWLGTGTGEERFLTGLRTMHDRLEKAGIRHTTFESPATAHEWQTWCRSLNDFAPRLFKERTAKSE